MLLQVRRLLGQLLQQSIRVAERIEAAGLRSGDRVIHIGPHTAAWPIVDFACLLSGVVHVASCRGKSVRAKSSSAIISATRVDFFRQISHRRASQRGLPLLEVQADWRADHVPHALVCRCITERVRKCDPDGPATVLISSGTTGRPKDLCTVSDRWLRMQLHLQRSS